MISQIILNKLSDISIRLKDVAGVFLSAAKNVRRDSVRYRLYSRSQKILVFSVVVEQALMECGVSPNYAMSPDAEAECFLIDEKISSGVNRDIKTLDKCLSIEKKLLALYDQISEFALPENIDPFVKTQKKSLKIDHKRLERFKEEILCVNN